MVYDPYSARNLSREQQHGAMAAHQQRLGMAAIDEAKKAQQAEQPTSEIQSALKSVCSEFGRLQSSIFELKSRLIDVLGAEQPEEPTPEAKTSYTTPLASVLERHAIDIEDLYCEVRDVLNRLEL